MKVLQKKKLRRKTKKSHSVFHFKVSLTTEQVSEYFLKKERKNSPVIAKKPQKGLRVEI